MEFRIGLHLGDIREKADGTIYGDGVNVAARLEGLAEPGRIIVSGSVHDSIRGRHGLNYHFLGEQDVKNIAEPVRAYRVLGEGEVPNTPDGRSVFSFRTAIAAGITAIVVVVGVVWWQMQEPQLPQMVTAEGERTQDPVLTMPSGPSVAVLPFENLSGDPGQDHFVDGISEDILTQLSRFSGIKVIARNSSFQLRGQALNAQEVGQKLGAEYVVEGSVRRAGDQLRITVQLLDAKDGSQMWAEAYDREIEVAALFEVQDAITSEIAGILAGATGVIARSEIESIRRKSPSSLDSYECVLLGHRYQLNPTAEPHLAGLNCLEAAVVRDPDYAEAWAWLAFLLLEGALWGHNADAGGPDPLARSEAAAKRALDEDRRSQRAHAVLAGVHYARRDIEGFVSEAELALAINPNDADVLGEMAWRFAYGVDWQRGLSMMEKAKALNPLHPAWYHLASFFDLYGRGLDQEALEAARKAETPDSYLSHYILAAAFGQLGRKKEAEAAIGRLLELYPDFREHAREEIEAVLLSDPEYVDRLMEGLKKAGLFDEPVAPARPIIAVLPFDNMSGDPKQEYFADGISEDIITRLARFPDIGVIARNSTFQYKNESVDIRDVAAELGATHVLEGSIRRSENQIRITVQLLEAQDGTDLWAEHYDRDLSAGSIFAVQDDITQHVVGAIASGDAALAQAAIAASVDKAPENLASYECVMVAQDYFRQVTQESHLRARTCLESVIEQEANYAEALARLAIITTEEELYGFNPIADAAAPLDRALSLARGAVSKDAGSAMAHWALARVSYFRGELSVFEQEAETAIMLAPNDAIMLAGAGLHLAYIGLWDRGLELLDKAMALNPKHQGWYHFPAFYEAYRRGDDQGALAAAIRVGMPSYFWSHALRAAAYGQLGMMTEAKEAVATISSLFPGYSIETMTAMHRQWQHHDDIIERMADGLRKAGLPETSG